MPSRYIYKICTRTQWQAARDSGTLVGNADDQRDGFLHFSGAEQLDGTLQKHFSGQGQLVLLQVAAARLGASLKYEVSRDGQEFPHLYGPLSTTAVVGQWPIPDDRGLLGPLLERVGRRRWFVEARQLPAGAWALAVASGTLYFLAFPGIDLWPLAFLAWVPFLLASRGRGAGATTALAWTSGFTMTFLGFYWVYGMLRDFSGFGPVLCIAFMMLLALAQGGRIALMGWLLGRGVSRGWGRGGSFLLAFAVSEFIYPLLFPWYFGACVYQLPALIQVADLGSPIVVGLVLCVINYALAELFVAVRGARPLPRSWLLAASLTLVVTLVYGAFRIRAVDAAVAAAPKGRVGIVQANLGLIEKREDRNAALRHHLELSKRLEAEGPLDLIVWSETSVAGGVYEDEAEERYRRLITRHLHTPTLFGGLLMKDVPDARGYTLFNAAMLSDRQGKLVGRYAKRELLPFGEYLPLGETFPALYDVSPNTGRFSPGPWLEPLPLEGRAINVHICYEDVLPGYVNRLVAAQGVELLVNMTNDAWYGDTTQPWIHLALAQYRAVEHRKFLVRGTNSGVSAFVDPAGRVVGHTDTFERTTLTHEVAFLRDVSTPYEHYGDLPWWACTAVMGYMCFRRRSAPSRGLASSEGG